MSSILEFIEVFNSPSNQKLFTQTACYWFARILCERFQGSTLVYNPHQVHFATKIRGNIYDITGLIDNPEEYLDWESYESEYGDAEMILQDCIHLERR